MITELQIQNFKAWRDTGKIRMAPLTVIFGANSAGKSSIGHLMLALKQTVMSADRKSAILLGDQGTLIDLGTFRDCLNGHDVSKEISFAFRWKLNEKLDIVNSRSPKPLTTRADEISLSTVLRNGKNDQPEVVRLEYRLFHDAAEVMDLDFFVGEDGTFEMKSDSYQLVKTVGRKWPLESPEKFYRASDRTLARFDNAGFFLDLALSVETLFSQFYYLGPLRDAARRTYLWSGEAPEDVGLRGERTIPALLNATGEARTLNRRPRTLHKPFAEFIAGWLKELGIIHSFSLQAITEGRREYEVLVRISANMAEVKLTDVGVGVAQVLPALVEAFYAPPGSTVWMEQPEIHLHPQVQSRLADALISAVQSNDKDGPRNVQLVVESHSEHLLNRLQRRIAEGSLGLSEVAIYFCKSGKSGPELEALELNSEGNIVNWPENFFGDAMEDVLARTEAAMKARISAQ